MNKTPNNLINEKSPYLQQHAYNPVNWHPWNNETLKKAKKENKCIFLSIGYSTCHWCHVMEKESFEDNDVAKLLNATFIPIKVDREERPDIDAMYMDICMMMTGTGGWPLNLFLTPDKKAFFAATYIPKENSYARPGLKELLLQIIDLWNNNPEEILNSAEKAMNAVLSSITNIPEGEKVTTEIIKRAYEILRASYDKQNAGFGIKPKFPSPHNLNFLLQIGQNSDFTHACSMAENTLKKIRKGGICDQLGGGFHRYSTDEKWILPHFEKMLYDQALLINAYTNAYNITKNDLYKKTVYDTVDFLKREMLSKTNAFFSALDADTGGEEGGFYVWEKNEIDDILSPEQAKLFNDIFNIRERGNFTDEATGKQTGKNVLYLTDDMQTIAKQKNIDYTELKNQINNVKKTLFKKREKRIKPFKDDKILTDWNGLVIHSLAIVGFTFNDKALIDTAKNCADFFLENAIKKDGTLYHRYKDGEWAIDAFLDDYAFLIYGLCSLYQSVFDVNYLSSAINLAEIMIKHFEDKQKRGFFLSPHYKDDLPVNKKEYFDGAYPSGNAIAAHALFNLSRLTGNKDYEEIAMNTVISAGKIMKQRPAGFTKTLSLFNMALSDFTEIVIVSNKHEPQNNAFIKKLRGFYYPYKCVLFKSPENEILLAQSAPFTQDMKTVHGNDTCYVCKNNACNSPLTDSEEMIKLLKE